MQTISDDVRKFVEAIEGADSQKSSIEGKRDRGYRALSLAVKASDGGSEDLHSIVYLVHELDEVKQRLRKAEEEAKRVRRSVPEHFVELVKTELTARRERWMEDPRIIGSSKQ